MAKRKQCVKIDCQNLQQYAKYGVCSWHYKELMGTYPQRPQRSNPNSKPAADLGEWDWIKRELNL